MLGLVPEDQVAPAFRQVVKQSSIPAGEQVLTGSLVQAGNDAPAFNQVVLQEKHTREGEFFVKAVEKEFWLGQRVEGCLLYTSPSPRDS